MKNSFSTSRKNINQDRQQSKTKVGDNQIDVGAKKKQVIEKQNSVNSSTSSTPTFITLFDDVNEDMEEIRSVIAQYKKD